MSQELDDGEFWLPSEFLTDDDLLMDFKTDYSKTKRVDDFSIGFSNSGLSSPVESVMGSTETESDEDDFVSGLTCKMAHSTLNDATFSADLAAKGLKLSGSPQSTLCGFKVGSRQSSPNIASRVSTPPESKDVLGWDLLYAAAGEVARMRMTEETSPFHSNKTFALPPKPSYAAIPVKNPNSASDYNPNYAQTEAHLAFLQSRATHLQRIKQQQMMISGAWDQGKMNYHQFNNGNNCGESATTQGLSTVAWPTLQQSQQQQPQPQASQPSSGMRAIFLGETSAKKERTGTGVFIPRRLGTQPAEIRKKPGCSTVLLPDRVVHALNLNFISADFQPQLVGKRNFITEHDGLLFERSNVTFPQQQRKFQIPHPAMNQELRLPQEWTY